MLYVYGVREGLHDIHHGNLDLERLVQVLQQVGKEALSVAAMRMRKVIVINSL